MNPTPASPSNRDLLWLIFGALMLIAGVQLIPIRGEARQWLGYGCLAIAGLVFVARFVIGLMKYAPDDIPSPLTDRTNKELPTSERK